MLISQERWFKKLSRIGVPGIFYVLVISGTDANEFIYMDDKREAIVEACENADYIISLS